MDPNNLLPDASTNAAPSGKYEIIIVGAGMAGLSAAYHILSKRPGTKLLLIESRDRVGGRIYSHAISGTTRIDLGASFIHGIIGNPLMELAKKIHLPTRRMGTSLRIVRADGSIVPPETIAGIVPKLFGTLFAWLDEVAQGGYEVPKVTESIKERIFSEGSPISQPSPDPEEDEIIRQFMHAFQGWTGAPLDYVSLKWWMFGQDTAGDDAVLLDGYGPLIDWLADEVKRLGGEIKLEERVHKVKTGERGESEASNVILTSSTVCAGTAVSKIYQSPFALLTLPLGVLQQCPPEFIPPLPLRRQQAIHRLGMGLLNKVVLIYEDAWWAKENVFKGEGEGALGLMLLPEKGDEERLLGPSRGLYPAHSEPPKGAFPPRTPEWLKQNFQASMLYDIHAQNGTPALCMFVPGEFGDIIETCEEEETKIWAKGVVHDWLGRSISKQSTTIEIPDPIEIICTNWRKDPDACGSYAYIPIGQEGQKAASPLDQVECSRTLWGRLFWAGEHTEVDEFASVHGAWTSGIREAEKILVKLNAECD